MASAGFGRFCEYWMCSQICFAERVVDCEQTRRKMRLRCDTAIASMYDVGRRSKSAARARASSTCTGCAALAPEAPTSSLSSFLLRSTLWRERQRDIPQANRPKLQTSEQLT